MVETDGAAVEGLEHGAEAPDRLAASARGWQRLQLTVLGFIGFCGIFWDGGDPAVAGMGWLPAALVVTAFVLAVAAILLVGQVAHPIDTTGGAKASRDARVAGHRRRLSAGIWMTYAALVLVVAATLSAWWPTPSEDGAVVVGDATGQVWCGHLAEAPAGEAGLTTADGPVRVPLDRVVLIRPVSGC